MMQKQNRQYFGSMLTDKDAVIAALEILRPENFYREDNKAIYEAIFNLYNKAQPIDIITVKSELVSLGKFEAIGRNRVFSNIAR